MELLTDGVDDPAALVAVLGDPHRGFAAYRRLLDLGPAAAAAARQGLTHADPHVRAQCAKVLDHVMDEASIPALLAALADPDATVRIEALHALSCDRCKRGDCRVDQHDALPVAIALLHADPEPRVRAMAAELVGAFVHDSDDAATALTTSRDSDPSPAVRKKSGWFAPGGTIFDRTRAEHVSGSAGPR